MSMESLKNRIKQAAEDAGCKMTHEQAKRVMDSTFDAIVNEARQEGRLIVKGFGTFSVVTKEARTGRNPATGEPVKIPKKTVLKFKSLREF